MPYFQTMPITTGLMERHLSTRAGHRVNQTVQVNDVSKSVIPPACGVIPIVYKNMDMRASILKVLFRNYIIECIGWLADIDIMLFNCDVDKRHLEYHLDNYPSIYYALYKRQNRATQARLWPRGSYVDQGRRPRLTFFARVHISQSHLLREA